MFVFTINNFGNFLFFDGWFIQCANNCCQEKHMLMCEHLSLIHVEKNIPDFSAHSIDSTAVAIVDLTRVIELTACLRLSC